jgi:hypothetical protein
LFFVFCFYSCDEEKTIQKQRELYFINSVKAVSEDEYYIVYNQANDSINTWIKNDLRQYKMQKYALEWQLDSLICFNINANKCIMSIMNRDKNGTNSINHFYGVKIKNNWCLFCGATLYAFSEYYGLPPKEPLSFDKLKQIATKNIYRGYLKKGKKGKWEINEAFFNRMYNKNQVMEGYGSCIECKTEEEYVLYLVNRNWQKRDTTNDE